MANTTHPKFVRWALLIGIVIALNLFFVAGRTLILPDPQYDDFCPTRVQPPATEEACVAANGVWVPTPQDPRVTAVTKPNPEGYCDLYQTCQPLFEEASKEHAMYTFVFMVSVGVLALILGVVPFGSSIVSSGLSYGGVLALLIAAGGYWNDAGNMVKLLMSLVALVALIYVGIRRFKD